MTTIENSSMKRTNRFQMRMNTIREKSNSKWKEFSNFYSKMLIHFPWTILGLSSLITIGLTVCFLLFMQIRSFDQNDFIIHNGQAMKNAFYLKKLFGNDTELRIHQQLNLYPGLDIIIKRKLNTIDNNINQTNMLNDEIVQEVQLLNKQIQALRINNSNNTIEYDYSSLCIKINHACVIDGNYILTDKFRQDISNLKLPNSGYFFDPSGANGVPGFMFGKDYQLINATPIILDYEDEDEQHNDVSTTTATTLEQIISYTSLFRFRYSLNTSTLQMRQLAIQWEREALKYLNEKYKSMLIDILPSTSTAITDSIAKKAQDEGIYMSIMILIFFILVCFSLIIQGNFHTSVGYLPLCGIISIGLSTGATFGLLSLFHVNIIEPMALLVFIVIIIDCMRFSIVCGEYHRFIQEHLKSITDTSSEIDIEKILPSIIESTHPYFILTTFIITIVYGLFSRFSPMSSTTHICLTLAFYIFINYLTHLTFFSSCLVITLKRVTSRRHCLFCCRLPSDYYKTTNEKTTKFNNMKRKISALFNVDSIWKKIFATTLCLLFIIFIIFSMWCKFSIDTRLFDDEFLPHDEHRLRSYMKSNINDFNLGPVIMFTIPKSVNYENEPVQRAMRFLIEQCQNNTRTNKFKLLWLDYEKINNILMGKESLSFRITPFSQNDLIVLENDNHSTIASSRFYCQYKSIKGDREDIETMNKMYNYAHQSLIPAVFPYSLVFPSYESLRQIRIEVTSLIFLLIIWTLITTYVLFVSFKNSFLLISHLFALIIGTLTCLYIFHNLTFNFADILWLYVMPIIFIDTLIRTTYNGTHGKWMYNRIILSLMISLLVLYIFPIQSYVFQIIRNSLMYESILCLIMINLILPSWFYLFQPEKKDDQINEIVKPTAISNDGIQSLTNGIEIKNIVCDSDRNINSSI